MKLPDKWEAIVDGCRLGMWDTRTIIERCYTLHCDPPKQLTEEEIEAIDRAARQGLGAGWQPDPVKFARDCIAAHERRQREPETVTFRAARRIADGKVDMLTTDLQLNPTWEWLEPPQTFEVKLP